MKNYCPKCGAETDEKYAFCEKCGEKLKHEAAATEARQESPRQIPGAQKEKTGYLPNASYQEENQQPAWKKKSVLKKKWIIAAALVFIALAVFFVGIVVWKNSRKGTAPEEDYGDVVVVGVYPDYEPFEYYDNNELVGFDIDLIRSIASYSGFEIEIKEVSSIEDLFLCLLSRECDCIISAIGYTEQGEKDFGCSIVYGTDIDPETNEVLDLVIYTAKGNGALLDKLDSGIRHLKSSGEIDRLTEKYKLGEEEQNNGEGDTSSLQEPPQKEEFDTGILVVRHNTGSRYTYNSTGTYKFTAFTTSVILIDPETGEYRYLKTFSSERTHSCSALVDELSYNTIQARTCFTPDFSKMTATVTLEDGSRHVGWVEGDGSFTDVTAKVTPPSGDFGALTKQTDACFSLDGKYFFFRDETDGSKVIVRVPVDDLSPDSVEVVLENEGKLDGLPINPLPDNTVVKGTKWVYYDINMRYPASPAAFYDWISETECVGNGILSENMIFRYKLSGEKDIYYWSSSSEPLVEYVEGRKNWDPVVSPNKDYVAFFSKLTTGTDQGTYLFTVPLSGGTPTKISTKLSFSENTYLIGWATVGS